MLRVPLGEEEDARPGADLLHRGRDGVVICLARACALDPDVAHRLHRRAEDGDRVELLLGDEPDVLRQPREDERRVDVRLVVAGEDAGARGQVLQPDHLLADRGRSEHGVAPEADDGSAVRPDRRAPTIGPMMALLPTAAYVATVWRSSSIIRTPARKRGGRRRFARPRAGASEPGRASPIATPPAGGIRPTASRNASSSGYAGRPRAIGKARSSSRRRRCSGASVSSENPLASSSPRAYSSNRSATEGSSGRAGRARPSRLDSR